MFWFAVCLLSLGGADWLPKGWLEPPSASAGMVQIDGAEFRPFYPPNEDEKVVHVAPFRIDRRPVTNGQFLRFVTWAPRYRRGSISPLFTDSEYLSHWAAPLSLGDAVAAEEPVTRVSWFAAKSYCQWRGARLPTEMEWELVAAADERSRDARTDAAFVARTMRWYSERTPRPPAVGRGAPNYYGVYDMHGLVWGWGLGFNSNLVSADSREKLSEDKQRYCGSGALSATDVSDYASFMRIAFRSSLQARFTTKNLGFRCASSTGAES
ncbi:MAG TPA: formylglycine-generating enzyme family protein [Polyangiaceae bacterium]|nr:formylglycine-generating enzyme family protein [Polyangiaceae bacterium]